MAEVKPFLDHGNYHVRNRARHILGQPVELSAAQKEQEKAAKKAAEVSAFSRANELLNDAV